MNEGEEPKVNLDSAKYIADYHKHITTLATGAILLLITFVDKLFANPKWKPLVVITILCFLGVIISCSFSYLIHVGSVENNKPLSAKQKRLDDYLGLTMSISFSCAFFSLIIFFVRNYLF